MAITIEQLKNLGFKPSVRGRGGLGKLKKYDSLIYPINDTDFLYTGYNPYKKQINYKTIWKSFKDEDGNRITYQVINLGDTGLLELKEYILRSEALYNIKQPKDIEAIPIEPSEIANLKEEGSGLDNLKAGSFLTKEGFDPIISNG